MKGSPAGAGGKRTPRGGVRVFAHTADVGLALRGTSVEDLLSWAALGFARLVTGRHRGRHRSSAGGASRPAAARADDADDRSGGLRVPVTLPPASDLEALLVSWLNFLVFLLETERLVPQTCDLVVTAGPGGSWRAGGSVTALPVAPGGGGLLVKAATYHGLKVRRSREGLYRARIILDV